MSADRPTEPRIAPVAEPTGEAAEVIEASLMAPHATPLNVFLTLVHHPKLAKRFNLFGGYLLNKGVVPTREREIVILRVGWNARSVYEFGQHTIVAERVGLSRAELAALASDDPGGGWEPGDRDLIALADELCAHDCVSATTFERLRRRWNEAELIELVTCAGFYRMVAGVLNTFGVQLDDGVPGWPPGVTP
jgi:alkylhydroperoxidase family enzyme